MKEAFNRLTVPLTADVYSCYWIIVSCAHPFNFLTRFFGLNQLRTVYTGTESSEQPWVQELLNETNGNFTEYQA